MSRVENRAFDGSLLSSFSTGDSFQRFALAMDPADHTLWMSRLAPGAAAWTTPPVLEQYSTAGTLLSVQAYPVLTGRVFGGAEFSQPVPEPKRFALMLAGLGVLAWVARGRRQHRPR